MKEAWSNYRVYDMTFGEALKDAWDNHKRYVIREHVKSLGLSEMYQTIEIRKQTKHLPLRFFKPRVTHITISAGAAAAYYYGEGRYNGD